MSKLEDWKVGDKGIIVSDNYSYHKFLVGEKVVVIRIDEDGDILCISVGEEDRAKSRFVDFRDIKKVENYEYTKHELC